MLQFPEIISLPSELRGTLLELMPEATFREELLCEGCLPLLLMMRSHAIAAIAVGDEADYELLYEAFKKYYLKCSAEWSAKDISFVFCLPAQIAVRESFRSRVEVDVYFCRKFVVQLGGDLASSLARLPFLPLSPITPGLQTRPPSAQTLLQQHNLKAELAKALVVPAKSSASAILAACLSGSYGAPEKISGISAEKSLNVMAEERGQATLKSISIQNFRAYRIKQEFPLGSAITILYGPNGFGKTSFFDAVDFAVTGGVARLAKAGGGLARAAKHLDSDGEQTIVSLTLERDGNEHVITRNLTEPNTAQVDGKAATRKEVLSLLTGGATTAADRVDNMVDLFRATHLFSQDNQELTRDVAEKCELPADIVSRMLAFEDYVSGLKKAEEVLKLARQTLLEARKHAQTGRLSIEVEQRDLKRLEGLALVNTSPNALDARFIELENAISASGFQMLGISPRDTRALRAMLESSAMEAANWRAAVSKALEHLANLKTLRKEIEPMRAHLEECRTAVGTSEVVVNAASARIDQLSGELAQFKEKEKAATLQRDWFMWAISAQPEYARLVVQNESLTVSLKGLTDLANQQREAKANALRAQQDATVTLTRCGGILKNAVHSRTRVSLGEEQARIWAPAEGRLIAAQSLEAQLQGSPETDRAYLQEAQQAVRVQELVVAQAERELSSAKSDDTVLKSLIAELRTHVDSATCLLCGHDHGSQESLLSAIDRRMEQGDIVVRLNEALAAERTKYQTLITALKSLSEKQRQDADRLAKAKAERELLERQQKTYEAALRSVGIQLSNDTPQQLAQMSKQVHEAEMLAEGALNGARELLAAADIALASAEDSYRMSERERQKLESKLDEEARKLKELLADANRGVVNMADGLQALNKKLRDADERLIQASSSVEASSAALRAQEVDFTVAQSTLTASRFRHQQAGQAWNSYQNNMQSVVAELAAASRGKDVSEDQLHQEINSATSRQMLALGLRDRVADLEIAVDTAATSAAFQNMRDRILTNEKLVQQADERAQELAPWVEFFEKITNLLGGQQAVATEHFISEYGPRTAVIQQRLRPVYGFGEIEVSSKDSAIGIRVIRNGQELRPTDYFSQSQVQTLVLGLFLTACSSQTWSGFSSIMMDDPVTHFDDLNTYALLDLILGLQSSPEGERQFVISTCDEKLLQLARQKFRHMGAAAKFYRFSAIGGEGPMVNEIPA